MASNPLKYLKIGVAIYLVYAAIVLVVNSNMTETPDEMDWEDRQRYNKIQIGKLELGALRKDVVSHLGSPDISEAKRVADKTLSLFFYRTQHVTSDGITTKDECTSLLFKDGSLVAWGAPAETMYLAESDDTDEDESI